MKLAMAISPPFGEEEAQRHREIHEQREREYRAQSRAKLCRELFNQTRRGLVLLLGLTITMFIVLHWSEIQLLAAQKASQAAAHFKNKAETSPLRQSALNHENEVNQITE